MSLPGRITTLLASLTTSQLAAMSAVERQKLSDECERVHRIINVEMIVEDARKATTEPGGVLSLLKRGDRAP